MKADSSPQCCVTEASEVIRRSSVTLRRTVRQCCVTKASEVSKRSSVKTDSSSVLCD